MLASGLASVALHVACGGQETIADHDASPDVTIGDEGQPESPADASEEDANSLPDVQPCQRCSAYYGCVDAGADVIGPSSPCEAGEICGKANGEGFYQCCHRPGCI